MFQARHLLLLGLLGLALVLLGACAKAATPTPTPRPTPTPTPRAVATPTPVATPVPGTEYEAKLPPIPPEKPQYNALGHPFEHPSFKFPANPKETWTAADIRRGGILRSGQSWEAPNWDPILAIGVGSGYMTKAEVVQERLLIAKRDKDISPYEEYLVPNLAKSWQVSGDGLTWTFKLEEGVKFQNKPPVNGREMTSADVKFSFEYYMSQPGILASLLTAVQSIDTPDKYTVVFRLKAPDSDFINEAGYKAMFILPREVKDRDGDFKKELIGTGAFQLKNFVQNQVFEVERNPNYWKKGLDGKQLPYMDGYIDTIIPDRATNFAALRAERIDITRVAYVTTAQEAGELLKTNPKLVFQQIFEPRGTFHLGMCVNCPPFDDVRVRRALALGIDMQALNQAAFDGEGVVAGPARWPGLFTEPPDVPKVFPWYRNNPQEAKKLLAEAGFPNGLGKVDMILYAYRPVVLAEAQVLQQQWKQAGVVDVEIKQLDYTTESYMNTSGTWDDPKDGKVGPIKLTWPIGEGSIVSMYYDQFRTGAGQNIWHISDPLMDQWLDAMKRSTDPKVQVENARKVYTRLLDQAYLIPLPHQFAYEPWQPWVKNFRFRVYRNFGEGRSTLREVWVDDPARYK